MTKHTSGPWHAKQWRVCANIDPNGPPIRVICDTANNPKTRNVENEANANLISAAPDLLAVAQAVLSMLDVGKPRPSVADMECVEGMARAAVNKAPGAES